MVYKMTEQEELNIQMEICSIMWTADVCTTKNCLGCLLDVYPEIAATLNQSTFQPDYVLRKRGQLSTKL